jgi:surface antigen
MNSRLIYFSKLLHGGRILMKNTLVILLVSLGLVSCSTNTTKENTLVGAGSGAIAGGLLGSLATGAGSGWIIGAGVVAGALIGSLIGNSMDSTDKAHAYTALDNNAPDQAANWKSTSTQTEYHVIPTSRWFTVNGNTHCRTYRTISVVNGEKQQVDGTACRQHDGSWKAVAR